MKRSPMSRGTKLLRAKKWGVSSKPRKPLKQTNAQRIAKRRKAYRAALRSKHAQELRELVRIRSGGICECGCGQPFSEDDPMQLGHASYARLGRERPEDVRGERRSYNLRERASRAWYAGRIA